MDPGRTAGTRFGSGNPRAAWHASGLPRSLVHYGVKALEVFGLLVWR